jgi:hypothetical protein
MTAAPKLAAGFASLARTLHFRILLEIFRKLLMCSRVQLCPQQGRSCQMYRYSIWWCKRRTDADTVMKHDTSIHNNEQAKRERNMIEPPVSTTVTPSFSQLPAWCCRGRGDGGGRSRYRPPDEPRFLPSITAFRALMRRNVVYRKRNWCSSVRRNDIQ